jgi:glutamate/tyrosine decarboxylase-like PLP-dependent enzyme
VTSGGSESLFIAARAALERQRASRRVPGTPELLMSSTGYPAFEKFAPILGFKVVRVPVDAAFRADPAALEAAMSENTFMLLGSVPPWTHGVCDPIGDLARIALRHDIWLHVDACVGGYLAPFVRMNGVDLPAFDFGVAGVSSISGDLHKYGYASKGASTVFFRSEALKAHMPFDAGPWPLGRMMTPTLAGTRPGGAIAAAWAVMRFLGVAGYRAKQAMVSEARARIEAEVKRLGFEVLGQPQLGIVAFTHPEADVFALLGRLHQRGWITGALLEPKALHLMLTPVHLEAGARYLEDLETALKEGAPGQGAASPGYGA